MEDQYTMLNRAERKAVKRGDLNTRKRDGIIYLMKGKKIVATKRYPYWLEINITYEPYYLYQLNNNSFKNERIIIPKYISKKCGNRQSCLLWR